MGQATYYFFTLVFLARWLIDYPWLLGSLVLIWLARRWLPDPYVWARTASRIRQLKIQIAQNADNATARRDLALLWLERSRPRRAVSLLEEARRRDGDSPELAYLLALALTRTGKHEAALPLLVEAQTKDPKHRYGEIYLTAAVALTALDRGAEAEESLLRFLKINQSSVEGWVRLAKLRRKAGDPDGARKALLGAVEAFDQSPRFQRRKQLRWYLRAQLARVILSFARPATASSGVGYATGMSDDAAPSPIVQAGVPVLRERAAEVPAAAIGTPELGQLVTAMVAAMRAAPGVGLAAPQLGVGLRLFVLEDPEHLARYLTPEELRERERAPFPLKVFINPVLTPIGEAQVGFFEGCLSVDGWVGYVRRYQEVEVSGLDETGAAQTWRVRGWAARILQHELDHLDGTLYIDRMATRSFARAELAAARFGKKGIEEVRRMLGVT